MKIRATVFLVFFFPTLALSQQALVEKGFVELFFSGAAGIGTQSRLYGDEIGAGLNGEAAISIAYASVDHKNQTWHTATITPTVTLAFHSKNTREQPIMALNFGVTTGKANGFIIPGISIAGGIKALTLEAGIGVKGKFKPQPSRA